jgi:hypothetical protein
MSAEPKSPKCFIMKFWEKKHKIIYIEPPLAINEGKRVEQHRWDRVLG